MKFFNYQKMRPAKLSNKAGFTLIEMMVAIFIFSVVMVLATGAIFSIVSADKTSQALKSVMDNLSSALDSMSREIRYGTLYYCGAGYNFLEPASCPNDNDPAVDHTTFAFIGRPTVAYPDGPHIAYTFEADPGATDGSGFINKCTDNNCVRLTAPEVHIQNVHFYVDGAFPDDPSQPHVLMTISGYAQAGSNKSSFNIETMVDQRNLDMCKSVVPSILRPSDGYCNQ